MTKMEKSAAQRFWAAEIEQGLKREKKWRTQGRKVVKRYRDANRPPDDPKARFNILWSNTEILKSATYSRKPNPSIQRRYKDNNPLGRSASEVLERAALYYSDEESFNRNIRDGRDDMLLPGRGVVWLQYAAEFTNIELEVMDAIVEGEEPTFMLAGLETEPDGFRDEATQEGPFIQKLESERIDLDYVYWEDFLHSNSRRWEEVWWCGRKHGMTVKELVSMFGKEVKAKLNPNDETDSEANEYEMVSVWEIWCKSTGERIWINEEAKDIFEREPVPLRLENFYPCPKPIYPFETTDTLIPTPEFCIYQDQANQLDDVENRLKQLRKALKAAGLYNSVNSAHVVQLQNLTDGQLAPVNMTAFKDSGGSISQQIEWWPIETIAAVMAQLETDRVQLKAEIYELTGISDILRGSTDPLETASAQRLKGSFGNLRLRPRREPIEELLRDIYSIMVEIIADHFSQETLEEITGLEINEQTMELLRNDKLRGFRIDVETDATVQPNQALDQEAVTIFLDTVGSFFAQALPVAESVPEMSKMLGEMIKMAANQFPAGRTLMPVIDETIQTLEQGSGETDETSPEVQAAQIEAQSNMQEAQLKAQVDLRKNQQDNQVKLFQIIEELRLKATELDQEFDIAAATLRAETLLKNKEIEMKAANDVSGIEIRELPDIGSNVRVGGEIAG